MYCNTHLTYYNTAKSQNQSEKRIQTVHNRNIKIFEYTMFHKTSIVNHSVLKHSIRIHAVNEVANTTSANELSDILW